ncbi:uncharacterized protein STEHIDRAFT_162643 [Stereum hirsutum FP-91666 SS1]|uniref:uncharacterized protein n=1 Tax=Stereum hirsutum (strain FP-91666) TaxID=721885 RepID=UPI0004449621|nr:uncharacterized protein STEHIDRAFT_162643 [Stereum hirsutum FP-91666 SS1]EIM80881.1 hypothetical protein STEHIDRAFT_162643 [Stereum hirsutum FP-91666 SS1]
MTAQGPPRPAIGITESSSPQHRARPPPSTSRADDWLGRAIDAANLISTAAQITPIAWISPAASLVVKFLEMVQKCGKNGRDLKELTEAIVEFIQAVHAVTAKAESASVLDFQQMCINFTYDLEGILSDLETMTGSDRGRLKQYLKSNSIAEKIATYKQRVVDLRSKLMLAATLGTRLHSSRVSDQVTALHVSVEGGFADVSTQIAESTKSNQIYDGEFRLIRKGDVHLLRQVKQSTVTIVSREVDAIINRSGKLSKRQRKILRYGEPLKRSFRTSHSTVYTEYIASVMGNCERKTVRVYKTEHRAKLLEDLARYAELSHPNLPQVFGISRSAEFPAIILHGDTTHTLDEHRAILRNSSAMEQFLFESHDLICCRAIPKCNFVFGLPFWQAPSLFQDSLTPHHGNSLNLDIWL